MSKSTDTKQAPKEPEPIVPADLKDVLAGAPKAKALWDDLTPVGRRDFISWIASAKQPETRKRRVDSVPSRLTSGKKRPCCYAVVPFALYKAIAANPKAKAAWGALGPMERRNFTDWINASTEKEMTKERTTKAAQLIAAGKKKP